MEAFAVSDAKRSGTSGLGAGHSADRSWSEAFQGLISLLATNCAQKITHPAKARHNYIVGLDPPSHIAQLVGKAAATRSLLQGVVGDPPHRRGMGNPAAGKENLPPGLATVGGLGAGRTTTADQA